MGQEIQKHKIKKQKKNILRNENSEGNENQKDRQDRSDDQCQQLNLQNVFVKLGAIIAGITVIRYFFAKIIDHLKSKGINSKIIDETKFLNQQNMPINYFAFLLIIYLIFSKQRNIESKISVIALAFIVFIDNFSTFLCLVEKENEKKEWIEWVNIFTKLIIQFGLLMQVLKVICKKYLSGNKMFLMFSDIYQITIILQTIIYIVYQFLPFFIKDKKWDPQKWEPTIINLQKYIEVNAYTFPLIYFLKRIKMLNINDQIMNIIKIILVSLLTIQNIACIYCGKKDTP